MSAYDYYKSHGFTGSLQDMEKQFFDLGGPVIFSADYSKLIRPDGVEVSYGGGSTIVGITGTIAQFNTALTDGDFATGGGTATGTNTGDQTSIVGITGTISQFNTAVTDADLAILGANTFTAAQEFATGANIASAATVNLDTATGNRVHITGTTTITAVTLTRGPRTVIFDGILTLTHHATNNNLPGAANITTAAGDRAIYESDGTTVYCISYIRKDGTPVVGGGSGSMILLSTVTASNSATVDIETTFDATYDAYVIVASGITVQTNGAALRCLLKVSAYQTTNYRYRVDQPVSGATTYTTVQSGGAGDVHIRLNNDTGNASTASAKFVMWVHNPSNAALFQSVDFSGSGIQSTGEIEHFSGSGTYTGSAGALTGVRIQPSSGNIVAGSFRLYGIKKA